MQEASFHSWKRALQQNMKSAFAFAAQRAGLNLIL
jgi:hypothetical protein